MERRSIFGLAGGIALLVVVSVVLVAASSATVGGYHAHASATLKTLLAKASGVHDSLSNPRQQGELNSATDIHSFKNAMDDYRAQVGGSLKHVVDEQSELKDEHQRLSGALGDPLTLTGRGLLQHDFDRLQSGERAMAAANMFLTLSDAQLYAFNTLLEAAVQLDNLVAYVQYGEISQANALMPALKQKLTDAETVSQGPNIAPQIRSEIAALKQAAADVGPALEAKLNNDQATFNALTPKIDADFTAVRSGFDVNGFTAFQHKLLDPLRQNYDREMVKAGFRVVSSPSPAT